MELRDVATAVLLADPNLAHVSEARTWGTEAQTATDEGLPIHKTLTRPLLPWCRPTGDVPKPPSDAHWPPPALPRDPCPQPGLSPAAAAPALPQPLEGSRRSSGDRQRSHLGGRRVQGPCPRAGTETPGAPVPGTAGPGPAMLGSSCRPCGIWSPPCTRDSSGSPHRGH